MNDGTWHFIQSMPGEEGKWFATAKEAGLLDLAIELANRSPSEVSFGVNRETAVCDTTS